VNRWRSDAVRPRATRACAAVLGLVLAGCSGAAAGRSEGSVTTAAHSSSTSPPTSSTEAVTTTTTPATTTTLPAVFAVGIRTVSFTDTTRPILDYEASPPTELSDTRPIATEIRYPTTTTLGGHGEVARAKPAAGGPFPVIVFAHGYAVMPDTYRLLLDAWVRAGFVVVSPVFPVTNYYEWLRQGGGGAPEADVTNQPYDVAFVIARLSALASDPHSFLDGLVDLHRLGLAGQSDGASTVAALVYANYYGLNWAALPVHPLAIAVLSGAEFGGSVKYADPAGGGPALLSVESDDDYCNPTQQATELYGAVAAGAPAHFFLRLEGADHSGPYFGTEPWAAVVRRVTTGFFELELGDRDHPVTPAGVARDGDVDGVTELSTASVVSLPATSASGDCGVPSPTPP